MSLWNVHCGPRQELGAVSRLLKPPVAGEVVVGFFPVPTVAAVDGLFVAVGFFVVALGGDAAFAGVAVGC